MARKIRFRGKDTQNEWVYGDLFHAKRLPGVVSIIDDEGINHIVSQDSVGQFTGLQDKNGKDIYEGDVIALPEESEEREIIFQDGSFGWRDHITSSFYMLSADMLRRFWAVVGNIHDNPELLTS